MKRWFTLIEMLIVIVIAAILMTITMQMGGRFIQDIKARQIREQVLTDYSIIRWQLLQSRTIDSVTIGKNGTISWGDDTLTLAAGEHTTTRSYPHLQISGPTITITPYVLWCTVESDNKLTMNFDLSKKTYCYTIQPSTCRLIASTCATDTDIEPISTPPWAPPTITTPPTIPWWSSNSQLIQ